MRVVHIAESMARMAGGVPAVVRQLAQRLSKDGARVQIAHATGSAELFLPEAQVFSFPSSRFGRPWSWGGRLRVGLNRLAMSKEGGVPIFHVHGTWSAPQYFAARAAYQASVPFVLTAHGMLEPWLWNEQGWKIRAKKRTYWSLLAYPALSKASVIHAITPLERDHLACLFPNKRIEVIPNAVNIGDENVDFQRERDKTILFLGRIEPKKGVDVLLHAFASAKIDKEWTIDVVGPAWSDAYLSGLKAFVSRSGLTQRVKFHGALFGKTKSRLIDGAWVLAVPSHSEVVGLVNLEAAARGLPTITTFQTGLYDWEEGGGLLVEPDVNTFRRALEVACSWGIREQRDRGLASRRLVRKRYSWQAVWPRWTDLYSSLL